MRTCGLDARLAVVEMATATVSAVGGKERMKNSIVGFAHTFVIFSHLCDSSDDLTMTAQKPRVGKYEWQEQARPRPLSLRLISGPLLIDNRANSALG